MNLEPLAYVPSRRRTLALLYVAFASGCTGFGNIDMEAVAPILDAGSKSSVWRDPQGNSPTGEQEMAARRKCDDEIKAAATDPIHQVATSLEDDCLVSHGWKKIPQPPEPKKK